MKAKHLIVLALVVGALLLVRLLLLGPEEWIRREMHQMGREASKSGPEKPIVAVATARSLASRFGVEAEGVDLREGRGVRGRQDIGRAIAGARESWTSGELWFEDLEVEMLGEESAEVRATVRIQGPGGEAASVHDGTRIRLEWGKEAGDWRILRAEVAPQ